MFNAAEPMPTAFLLAVFGVLMVASVLLKRSLDRLGIPVVLLFLVLGMLAGSEGLGRIPFDDHALAFRLGTVALVLILFDGGFSTSLRAARRVAAPASVLATLGVALTAGLTALGARLLGLGWAEALLLGAVVSSTDAATVFAVLRGSRLALKPRLGATLELESGLNDPMAVILTVSITTMLSAGAGRVTVWTLLWSVPLQLAVGVGVGLAVGFGLRGLLARLRLSTAGLYPVVTLAGAFIAFGGATILQGSGFLAVYLAAMIAGNAPLPYKAGVARVHDALAWLSQIGMFLMLGLLVFPSRLPAAAAAGLAVAVLLAFAARPAAVWLSLLPFRFPPREVAYLGWVGLRGAVPIVLATFPVMSGVPGAERVFDIVFFIVVVNALLPGATVRWLTRRWRLDTAERPAPDAVLEINSAQPLGGELVSFFIEESVAVCGAALSEIEFPEGARAVLLYRDGVLQACAGDTRLRARDHVYVFCRREHRPIIELFFGHPQNAD